ncbi:hypothetical protein [Hydrocoleum sp. CS-953]|uniref:DUF6887 family protein n=1 Tax=Hydrocoleum sp. CS-953 TaxID=1671698 RepID=UPI00143DDD8E|nr:hypothetical protein [Hydrocoleum sp. CS-953]
MMTKPDLNKITHQQLRSYILAHRENDDAIKGLIKRGNSHTPNYPFPQKQEDI